MTVERRRRKHRRVEIRITGGKVTEASLFSVENSSSVSRRRRQSRESLVRKADYDVPLKVGQKVKFRTWSGTTKIVETGVVMGIDGIVVHIKARNRSAWSILYDKHKGLMWL
jgi:hypothetical protein